MRAFVPLLLLMIVLTGCARNSGASSSEAAEDIALPDVTLLESSFTLGQDGQNPLYITSGVLELTLDENKARAGRISFYQNDDEGKTFITGYADRADIDTGTKVVELYGNACIEQLEDGLSIRAEEMTFDSETQKVESVSSVSITFDGGRITGKDLSADLNASTLEMREIEEGVLTL